ncbi:MAG TPA: MamI family restriction endonuclease [Acidimicrobiia bacterium]|nr:MamI family restriction endonuclease [Acidimicrobiia bacterium]
MSQPDPAFITIQTGVDEVKSLLDSLFTGPRRELRRWSEITGQTAQVRIAYPGQHLASMVTGVKGAGTAARGMDLRDGSEVKSCSRADQLGECRSDGCDSAVLPWETECPQCGGTDIRRKVDSHWIIAVTSEQELAQYLAGPRLVLILFDRPEDSQTAVRVRAWEVWTQEDRHSYFSWFLTDYFLNNYAKKIEAGRKPAPCNLHPLKQDFYMMNPVLVFEALILDADTTAATTDIVFHFDPKGDRAALIPEAMPASSVVPRAKLIALASAAPAGLVAPCVGLTEANVLEMRTTGDGIAEIVQRMTHLDESLRILIPRPEKRIKLTPSTYVRRGSGAP